MIPVFPDLKVSVEAANAKGEPSRLSAKEDGSAPKPPSSIFGDLVGQDKPPAGRKGVLPFAAKADGTSDEPLPVPREGGAVLPKDALLPRIGHRALAASFQALQAGDASAQAPSVAGNAISEKALTVSTELTASPDGQIASGKHSDLAGLPSRADAHTAGHAAETPKPIFPVLSAPVDTRDRAVARQVLSVEGEHTPRQTAPDAPPATVVQNLAQGDALADSPDAPPTAPPLRAGVQDAGENISANTILREQASTAEAPSPDSNPDHPPERLERPERPERPERNERIGGAENSVDSTLQAADVTAAPVDDPARRVPQGPEVERFAAQDTAPDTDEPAVLAADDAELRPRRDDSDISPPTHAAVEAPRPVADDVVPASYREAQSAQVVEESSGRLETVTPPAEAPRPAAGDRVPVSTPEQILQHADHDGRYAAIGENAAPDEAAARSQAPLNTTAETLYSAGDNAASGSGSGSGSESGSQPNVAVAPNLQTAEEPSLPRETLLPPQDRAGVERQAATRAAPETNHSPVPPTLRDMPPQRVGADKADVAYNVASPANASSTTQTEFAPYGAARSAEYSAQAASTAAQPAAQPATASAVQPLMAAVPLPINTVMETPKPRGMTDRAIETETGLVARGSEQSGETRLTSPVARPVTTDGADVLQEVVRAALATKGSSTIELRLDPSELGQLDIELSFNDERVSILVRGDRDDGLDLMRRSSDDLTRMLRQAGLDLDTLNFSRQHSDDRSREQRSFTALSTEMVEGGGEGLSPVASRYADPHARVDIRI